MDGPRRWLEPDDPDMLEARRNLKAARLEEKICSIVDAAPPLSDAQRVRLTLLLNGGAA